MIKYIQHEFHAPNRKCETPLAQFMLDIPYLLFRGVIPPLLIINEVLKTGGGNGGMSPGTSWEPFEISDKQYQKLVSDLLNLDLDEIKRENKIRFIPDKIIEDEELHNVSSHLNWLKKVKGKYG